MSVNIIHGTKTVRWDTDLVKYILNEGEPIRNLKKLFTTDMLTFMLSIKQQLKYQIHLLVFLNHYIEMANSTYNNYFKQNI
jgi:hypothetical protein